MPRNTKHPYFYEMSLLINVSHRPRKKQLNKISYYFLVLAIFLVTSTDSHAQQQDTSIFKLPITLDTFTVKTGFDVDAFIRRVRTDTTFYKAFKSMHLAPYTAVNNFQVFDKKDRVIASLNSKTQQFCANNCRTTKVLEQKTTGDFFKRDESYNYYTAELFAYLFLAPTPVCNETDVVAGSMEERGKGQNEKSKYELKQLVFNPGSKVSGVPLMGDRASIFDEDEAKKYNFKIAAQQYDGQDCYVFTITPKTGYEHSVIYDELTTWFRKSDYSIVARDYSLSYHTLVYDFDVRMKVRTKQIANRLYPTSIAYDGNWHVFTKKRERVKFNVEIQY